MPAAAPLVRDREAARGEPVYVGGGIDEVLVEIHKLKARQVEIRELEAVAKERAATFRQHLEAMLEGAE